MDDSSMFLQWAMDQLDHHHPSAVAAAGAPAYPNGGGAAAAGDRDAAFPSLQALRNATQPTRDLTVQVDHHRTNSGSWSSGDSPGGAAMDYDAAAGWSPHTACARTTGLGGGVSNISRPVSWNFSAASAQPTDENGGRGGDVALPPDTAATAARASTGRRGGGSAASSSPGPVQDHIIAERRRREKINQRFIELSTVIPGLKKMDKATILGDAVKYVRELQDKVKTLEKDGGTIQSTVLVKKPCRMPDEEGVASGGGGNGGLHHQQLPEIEARLSEKSVLLRIHCDNAKGLLVKLLSEVEKMSLSITHTNVMPFPASTAIITITAKAST
ncbi:hypothetical protein PR202_ga11765 [Eleusine coracana subsp. coracana]|uniref:BHLH domain-containing protein n=1 Tax=Eleusine coracana subsp. coracana TaxID=191504 RepID=A0AAV5C9V7_ELECO|nr:hypothetical protein PR202_ga11765 [Eleusine coracana subsp. coracana]